MTEYQHYDTGKAAIAWGMIVRAARTAEEKQLPRIRLRTGMVIVAATNDPIALSRNGLVRRGRHLWVEPGPIDRARWWRRRFNQMQFGPLTPARQSYESRDR